jgi:hypothetical protein
MIMRSTSRSACRQVPFCPSERICNRPLLEHIASGKNTALAAEHSKISPLGFPLATLWCHDDVPGSAQVIRRECDQLDGTL